MIAIRLLLALFSPFRMFLRLLGRPWTLWSQRRLVKEGGWLELHLEGNVVDHWHPSRIPAFVRKFLGREEGPEVVLSSVRRLGRIASADRRVKGVLVKMGLLGGGWAAAAVIRAELARLRDAGKKVVVHFQHNAGNREYYIATAGTKLLAPPSANIAPVGAAAQTVFLRDTLEKAGVKFEVISRGRYKSAPDQLTRTSRSEFDLEQTRALVEAIDGALVEAISESRKVPPADASRLLETSPMVGRHAIEAKALDALAYDEDLPKVMADESGVEKPPQLIPAGAYLSVMDPPPAFGRKKKFVAIVEVHGAIVEQGSPMFGGGERVAIEAAVVADLRAARAEPRIGAVVLHVKSRGGGVGASDNIYSAVRRLNEEKPVIACFADVAASGGYYVACGARAIVASPLTVTGSIGVFMTLPVWPVLAERLGVHHDVVRNHKHAGLLDPWRGLSEEERLHMDREVGAMYEDFIQLVARARKKTRDEIHQVAEGRVWTGSDAMKVGLVDGLGGVEEAVERAKQAAGGAFMERPVLIRARKPLPRPGLPEKKAAVLDLVPLLPSGDLLAEMIALHLSAPRARAWAYAPIDLA